MKPVEPISVEIAHIDRASTDLLDVLNIFGNILHDYKITCGNCQITYIDRLKTPSGYSGYRQSHSKCKICGVLNKWEWEK